MIYWQCTAPKRWLSMLIFHFARIENVWLKNTFINCFIKNYQVDLADAERENVEDYQHFNDFFTRALKPGARQISNSAIICPVDGVVSQLGKINNSQIIQAKNHYYSIPNLLANDSRSAEFASGFFATIYLSPKDYHRVHMPYDGKLLSMSYIPGNLFSVNQKAAENIDNLFAKNERVVCYFETEFGLCALLLVGAIFVASIQTVWHGQIKQQHTKKIQQFDYSKQTIKLKKGEEMGRFNMGSTVIMLSSNAHNPFSIAATDTVKMGQSLLA